MGRGQTCVRVAEGGRRAPRRPACAGRGRAGSWRPTAVAPKVGTCVVCFARGGTGAGVRGGPGVGGGRGAAPSSPARRLGSRGRGRRTVQGGVAGAARGPLLQAAVQPLRSCRTWCSWTPPAAIIRVERGWRCTSGPRSICRPSASRTGPCWRMAPGPATRAATALRCCSTASASRMSCAPGEALAPSRPPWMAHRRRCRRRGPGRGRWRRHPGRCDTHAGLRAWRAPGESSKRALAARRSGSASPRRVAQPERETQQRRLAVHGGGCSEHEPATYPGRASRRREAPSPLPLRLAGMSSASGTP